MDMTQTIAESILNPGRFYLSDEAKKRLRWMYVIEYQCHGNVSCASGKVGVSREWLAKLHAKYERSGKDPKSLEPASRAPHNRTNRKRISLKAEDLIVKVRKKRPAWGKEKIARILERDHKVKASPTTVGRYLKKHHLIDVRLSIKNTCAWRKRKAMKNGAAERVRHPRGLGDAGPGALVAKDMKYITKPRVSEAINGKFKAKDLFWYQHSIIDSCTRIKAIEIVDDADAGTAKEAYATAVQRLPFEAAAITSDNGSENDGVFDLHLQNEKVLHYWSRAGVPTDNPRVERSHLSDDVEFYRFNGHAKLSKIKLKEALNDWETTWNEERPHQALDYLTPKEYFKLWHTDCKKALDIQKKWSEYMKKQGLRLRASRQEQKQDKIYALNKHLKSKLGANFIPLKV